MNGLFRELICCIKCDGSTAFTGHGQVVRAKNPHLTNLTSLQMHSAFHPTSRYAGIGVCARPTHAVLKRWARVSKERINMDYTKLLNRAFNIVWDHKFLIILGVLVALGGGTPGNQLSWRADSDGNGNFDFGTLPGMNDETVRQIAIPAILVAISILLMFALVVWAISLIARGGLIVGVDTIETGGTSSFVQAWSRGWARAGSLLGIGLMPAIPLVIALIAGLIGAGFFMGLFSVLDRNVEAPLAAGVGTLVIFVACIAAPPAFGPQSAAHLCRARLHVGRTGRL